MPPIVATFIYVVGILILFRLDRDTKRRMPSALWIPITWLLISGSRSPSAWFQGGISPDQMMEGNPVDRIIYLALQIAGIVVLARRQTAVTKLLRANFWIFLFVFYCAISICWSDYPDVAFKRWIKLIGDFTMVLIILTSKDRLYAIKRVITTVGFVLIPSSILLIKYYPELSRYYSAWEGKQFFSGVATDKNMLGMTCLIYGLGILWQFLAAYRSEKDSERTRRMTAHGIALAMTFWLFSSADSMTSLSCFMMGAIVIVSMSLMKAARKPLFTHVLVALIVGASFSILFLHVGEGAALSSMGRNPTLTGRTEIWAGLLKASGNPIVGAGFDSFWLGERLKRVWASGELLWGLNEAHNGYLETYLNLGWIGVSLLAGMIVIGYRNILSAFRKEPEISILRLGLFVVAVVYSYTEAGFRTNGSVWIFFLIVITAVPLASVPRISRASVTKQFLYAESEEELCVNSM